jgi:hypothetical protein
MTTRKPSTPILPRERMILSDAFFWFTPWDLELVIWDLDFYQCTLFIPFRVYIHITC